MSYITLGMLGEQSQTRLCIGGERLLGVEQRVPLAVPTVSGVGGEFFALDPISFYEDEDSQEVTIGCLLFRCGLTESGLLTITGSRDTKVYQIDEAPTLVIENSRKKVLVTNVETDGAMATITGEGIQEPNVINASASEDQKWGLRIYMGDKLPAPLGPFGYRGMLIEKDESPLPPVIAYSYPKSRLETSWLDRLLASKGKQEVPWLFKTGTGGFYLKAEKSRDHLISCQVFRGDKENPTFLFLLTLIIPGGVDLQAWQCTEEELRTRRPSEYRLLKKSALAQAEIGSQPILIIENPSFPHQKVFIVRSSARAGLAVKTNTLINETALVRNYGQTHRFEVGWDLESQSFKIEGQSCLPEPI